MNSHIKERRQYPPDCGTYSAPYIPAQPVPAPASEVGSGKLEHAFGGHTRLDAHAVELNVARVLPDQSDQVLCIEMERRTWKMGA